MEPVSMILAALAAGAAAAAKDTASTAVKEGYEGLKALLKRRFAGDPGSEVALERYPDAPTVWQKPLEHALEETGAGEDEEIVQAAQALATVVDPQGAAAGKYTLNISGGTVQGLVQGDQNQVTQNFGTSES